MKDSIVTTQPETIKDEYTEQPYGKCSDCNKELASRPEVDQHLDETRPEPNLGKSHSVRIINPSVRERAQSRVRDEVEEAIDRALSGIERLLNRGEVTREDVKEALVWHSDFQDAWDERLREDAKDEADAQSE